MLILETWPDRWIHVEHSKSGKTFCLKANITANGRIRFIFDDDPRNFEINLLRRKIRGEKVIQTPEQA